MSSLSEFATMKHPLVPSSFADHFAKAGFDAPTPVQKVCWPTLLKGCNALVCAPTGSGKTLGFLLPLGEHAKSNPVEAGADDLWGPSCLVLSPTRELAQQITAVARKLTSTVCLCGGVNKEKQLDALLARPSIVVATPEGSSTSLPPAF